jgi:hypothetical protein
MTDTVSLDKPARDSQAPLEPLEPLKPRTGTIVWGVILLVVATITVLGSTLDLGDAEPATVVWAVIGLGGALVLAAIIVAIARAARRGTES